VGVAATYPDASAHRTWLVDRGGTFGCTLFARRGCGSAAGAVDFWVGCAARGSSALFGATSATEVEDGMSCGFSLLLVLPGPWVVRSPSLALKTGFAWRRGSLRRCLYPTRPLTPFPAPNKEPNTNTAPALYAR